MSEIERENIKLKKVLGEIAPDIATENLMEFFESGLMGENYKLCHMPSVGQIERKAKALDWLEKHNSKIIVWNKDRTLEIWNGWDGRRLLEAIESAMKEQP